MLVLLTDGRNQPAVPQPTDPVVAARLTRDLGVTLHTIAIGAVKPPEKTGTSSEDDGPDFALLERLAKLGGGRSFVAADSGSLDRVFAEIDALEKSPVRGEVWTRYREEYGPWAAAAVGLLLLDRLLAAGWLQAALSENRHEHRPTRMVLVLRGPARPGSVGLARAGVAVLRNGGPSASQVGRVAMGPFSGWPPRQPRAGAGAAPTGWSSGRRCRPVMTWCSRWT